MKPFEVEGSSRYGALMGRGTRTGLQDLAGSIYLAEVTLDEGGYDPGGAYWGTRTKGYRLYCAWGTEGGEYYLDAPSPGAAAEKLRSRRPDLQEPFLPAPPSLSVVVEAYLVCALWSTGGTYPDGEEFEAFDVEGFTQDDLAPEVKQEAERDCQAFLEMCAADLAASGLGDGQIGHDFWLSRNGHGAGFWDRDLGEIGERLTKAAKTFGEINLYVGDDGKVYSD